MKPVIIELTDFKTREKVDELEVDACMVATGRAPFTQVRICRKTRGLLHIETLCIVMFAAFLTWCAHACAAILECLGGLLEPLTWLCGALQGLNLQAVGAATVRGGFIPVNEKMQVACRALLLHSAVSQHACTDLHCDLSPAAAFLLKQMHVLSSAKGTSTPDPRQHLQQSPGIPFDASSAH